MLWFDKKSISKENGTQTRNESIILPEPITKLLLTPPRYIGVAKQTKDNWCSECKEFIFFLQSKARTNTTIILTLNFLLFCLLHTQTWGMGINWGRGLWIRKYENANNFSFFGFHFVQLYIFPNEYPVLCWHRLRHLLGENKIVYCPLHKNYQGLCMNWRATPLLSNVLEFMLVTNEKKTSSLWRPSGLL